MCSLPGQGEVGNAILLAYLLGFFLFLCPPQLCYPVSPTSTNSIFSPLVWTRVRLLRHSNAR